MTPGSVAHVHFVVDHPSGLRLKDAVVVVEAMDSDWVEVRGMDGLAFTIRDKDLVNVEEIVAPKSLWEQR